MELNQKNILYLFYKPTFLFIKKCFYVLYNLLIWFIYAIVNLIRRPIHMIAHRLPVSVQRVEYKLDSHYLRLYRSPCEKQFVPESNKVIIFLPLWGWNNMKQRPHHLPRAFSRAGWTAIFLTNDPVGDDVNGIKEIGERLFLCSDVRILKNIKNPWVYVNWLVNIYYLKFFNEYRLIYDYVDKLEIMALYTNKMIREQRKALETAKVVMATSSSLMEDIINIRKDALLIPNAVFPDDFVIKDDMPVPEDVLKIVGQGKPIIGYYGIFSKWKIDYKLIQYTAKELPGFNFVMIGPGFDFDNSLNENEWEKFPNIYFLGKKDYQELLYYAFHFDVAVLPFIVNEVTNAISPVKLFEYFAMKLPVVATNISECRKYKSVLIAMDHKEFLQQISKALSLKNDPTYQTLMKEELYHNTWDYRCEMILNRMKDFI